MAIESFNDNVMLVVKKADLVEFALSLMDSAKSKDKDEKFLTPDEVCAQYRVSLTTLWRWRKRGVLIPKKVGAKTLYKESDVKAYFE